jgi:hypothetical protein
MGIGLDFAEIIGNQMPSIENTVRRSQKNCQQNRTPESDAGKREPSMLLEKLRLKSIVVNIAIFRCSTRAACCKPAESFKAYLSRRPEAPQKEAKSARTLSKIVLSILFREGREGTKTATESFHDLRFEKPLTHNKSSTCEYTSKWRNHRQNRRPF